MEQLSNIHKITVIGIGEYGADVLNLIAKNNKDAQTIFVKRENEYFPYYADIILDLNDNVEEKLKQVNYQNRIFIVNHLGCKECDDLNVELVSKIEKEGKQIVEICSFPFTFEGKKRISSACNTLESLSEYIDKIIVTDDELIIKDLDGKTKINDVYKFVSKILYTNIQNIANNTELEYEKYIIEYDETEEEIKKRKMPKLHFQEVNNEDNK